MSQKDMLSSIHELFIESATGPLIALFHLHQTIATDIKKLVLPTPQKQKAELKRVITKRTNKLVKEATRIQKSRNFNPAKLEAVVAEIRYLRSILNELVNATMGHLEELYKKFIWRQ